MGGDTLAVSRRLESGAGFPERARLRGTCLLPPGLILPGSQKLALSRVERERVREYVVRFVVVEFDPWSYFVAGARRESCGGLLWVFYTLGRPVLPARGEIAICLADLRRES